MQWNWQDPNWPNFRWDSARLASEELAFAEKSGVLIGSSSHLDQDNRSQLVVVRRWIVLPLRGISLIATVSSLQSDANWGCRQITGALALLKRVWQR